MKVSNHPWDPYQTLTIEAISAGFTCVGHAASKGRRCHNPIAAVNRRDASTILSNLSKLDIMSANLESLLTELASLLLCRRWHQGQASTVTMRWLGKMDKLKGEELARRQSEEDILSALSAIFLIAAGTNETQQPATTPPLAITARSAVRSLPSSGNRPLPSAVHESASSQAEEPATTRPSPALDDQTPEEADADRSDPTDVSPEIPIPVAGSIPTAPGSESSTEESHDHTTVPAAGESHDHAAVTAAEAETECSICYEELSSDSSLVSCRTQCRHTFHTECMNSWFETSDALERTRTCPYCRCDWNRRSVEGDCTICRDALHDEDQSHDEDEIELVWCRALCGQNFHAKCMSLWLETSEAGNRVGTCPDCRAQWNG